MLQVPRVAQGGARMILAKLRRALLLRLRAHGASCEHYGRNLHAVRVRVGRRRVKTWWLCFQCSEGWEPSW